LVLILNAIIYSSLRVNESGIPFPFFLYFHRTVPGLLWNLK